MEFFFLGSISFFFLSSFSPVFPRQIMRWDHAVMLPGEHSKVSWKLSKFWNPLPSILCSFKCEILEVAPLGLHPNLWNVGSPKPCLLIPCTEQAPRLRRKGESTLLSELPFPYHHHHTAKSYVWKILFRFRFKIIFEIVSIPTMARKGKCNN